MDDAFIRHSAPASWADAFIARSVSGVAGDAGDRRSVVAAVYSRARRGHDCDIAALIARGRQRRESFPLHDDDFHRDTECGRRPRALTWSGQLGSAQCGRRPGSDRHVRCSNTGATAPRYLTADLLRSCSRAALHSEERQPKILLAKKNLRNWPDRFCTTILTDAGVSVWFCSSAEERVGCAYLHLGACASSFVCLSLTPWALAPWKRG